jgi:hypothetical protein
MSYLYSRKRARRLLSAIAAPFAAAGLLACEASDELTLAAGPQFAYSEGGEPELALCDDPTPGQKWTASVTPAGGTLTMGPNSVIVPANAVSSSGLIYLRELDSSSLQMRLTSSVTLNATVEVVVSTENCEVIPQQTVWLYDEAQQQFEDIVDSDPGNQEMRFWTIQPGAYALAN